MYCKKISKKANLNNYICGCLTKPNVIIDDLLLSKFIIQKTIKNGKWDSELSEKLKGDYIEDYDIEVD